MDDSLETWLHELEMEVGSSAVFFPEMQTKKLFSSDQKLYHQPSIFKPETNDSINIPLSVSEASLSFSHLDSNDMKKKATNWIEFDAAMKNGQPEGDKWRSKMTALPLPLPLPHHIVVERKRREDLNQRFFALSKVLPCSKKKDKASILGEAVKYMRDLQERIQKLEDKSKKKVVESVIFVQRSSSSSSRDQYLLHSNNNNNNNDNTYNNGDNYCCQSYAESDDDNFSNKKSRALLEIEAKVTEKSVLIRVHCGNHRHRGMLPTLLTQIAKLQLIVVTTNIVPFGNDTDITVIAQMGANFCMKTRDIVEYLRLELPNFI